MLRRTFLAQSIAFAIQRNRIESAQEILEEAYVSGEIQHSALYVRQGGRRYRFAAGPGGDLARPFLLASITKPMTATAAMMLVEQGELSLDDTVVRYIPEYKGDGREQTTVRQLLTHTSGLPDMLPENDQLRADHAPLSEFAARACKTPLLFEPGKECRYQSMGILLAAEIIEHITKMPLRRFLKQRLFQPLDMRGASLGMGGRELGDTAVMQVSGNDDWNWNSAYWRNLGAPWGGAHGTVEDVAKFVEYFLQPDWRVLHPDTARMMITDQNRGLNQPWGIGWSVKPGGFGAGCSPHAFGHGGSTGTLCWADPGTNTSFVILTSRPAAESNARYIKPISDMVSQG